MSEELKQYTRTTQWDALDQFANTWEAEYRIGSHQLYVLVERDKEKASYRARATGPDGKTLLSHYAAPQDQEAGARAAARDLDAAAEQLMAEMVDLYSRKGLLTR